MFKAVFLDRDGTIVEDVGYMKSPSQINFLPGAIDAIKKLKDNGFKVIVITNQSGIARDLLSEEDFKMITAEIDRQLLANGAKIEATYHCPHHPKQADPCECRKPNPGMILKAAKEHQIDLKSSFMIGDKDLDVECGQRAGTKSIRLASEYEMKQDLLPDYIAKDLPQAVEWIMALSSNG